MTLMLVIVPEPESITQHEERQRWGGFYSHAKIEKLSTAEGVFWISNTAWIFDTRKNLPAYARVVHQAAEYNVQLFSFQLPDESVLARVSSCPRSETLDTFLESYISG